MYRSVHSGVRGDLCGVEIRIGASYIYKRERGIARSVEGKVWQYRIALPVERQRFKPCW